MRRFVVADLHFGHANVIQYAKRPFADVSSMDEKLIRYWNSVVAKDDLVYVLGDFTLSRKLDFIKDILDQLHGRKILIMGNHDTRKPADYIAAGFVGATRKPMMVEPGVILMHEPFSDARYISPQYLYFFGHVHDKRSIMDDYPNCKCVSVERVNYRPVDLDECMNEMLKRKR